MELKKTPYRIIPFGRVVLLKLYIQFINDAPNDRFTTGDVHKLFDVDVSKNLVENALERLRREGLLTGRGAKKTGDRGYVISDQGILVVERALRNSSSDLAYYRENGDQALEDVAGFDAIFWKRDEFLEAADWQPIEFDRESDEFNEAISALEEAVDAVESSNELAAEFPEQQKAISGSLRDGLAWLKKKKPTRSQLKAMLIDPLHWLVTSFGKGFVSEVAKKAAQKIADLIHSVFF